MSGYLLLDQPNPNGKHFYPSRNRPVLAIVVHVTAGLEDLDTIDDHSAEATAQYAATTATEVSWHSGSDTDSAVYLLPASCTAWHATAYNSSTYGHEISKNHTDWRTMPDEWTTKTLTRAGAVLGPIAAANNIPNRKATRAELDREIANYDAGRPWQPVGYISHAELQSDRRDPGWVSGVDTFPWTRFLGLTQGDDMSELAEQQIGYINKALGDAYENTPTGEITISTRVKDIDKRLGYVEKALGDAYDGATDTTIGDRVKTIEATVQKLATSGVPVDVRLSDEDVTRIATEFADLMDERARDNDSTTGPAS
jgi:hypothetical protein